MYHRIGAFARNPGLLSDIQLVKACGSYQEYKVLTVIEEDRKLFQVLCDRDKDLLSTPGGRCLHQENVVGTRINLVSQR